MKCSFNDCKRDVENFEDYLEKGVGWCTFGHRNKYPGRTDKDLDCDCGARSMNAAGHAYWCRNLQPYYSPDWS